MKMILTILLLIHILGCDRNDRRLTYKTIKIGKLDAKGLASSDSIFDGSVEFYDGKRLVGSRTYKNGSANGEFKNYHYNGVVKQMGIEKDNLLDSTLSYFNSRGQLTKKEYYYFGRLIGPQHYYDSLGGLSRFLFLNFENTGICEVDYNTDTVFDVSSLVFTNFSEVYVDSVEKLRIFLYLIRPEKYRVQHSIGYVLVENPKDFTLLHHIDSKGFFFENEYVPPLEGKNMAVKSIIYDSATQKETVMFSIYR